ncbi:MAG: hypothetical protein P9E24_08670 [Candidatus Competibacter sp.]|nr:hypothetical protein [Candidatus Competibacter sp.]MDG4585128.1 hypothetical protein [Candidatus Competibacter sp.]
MAKKKSISQQNGLFGADIACPDLHNLPLILEPRGAYEVFAPGSVYQPVLLTPGEARIDVGPGKLDAHEEQFVRDLIHWLYPAGNPPRSEKTPLAWNGREVWLKRNIEKDPRSFRLRMDDSDWFYPDFIVWIVDPATRTQTFGFIDPKGLALGTPEGWADYKIVATLYMPHVVALQLGEQPVEYQGERWRFRIRGVLVSTSPFEQLREHAKFDLRNDRDENAPPTEADFQRARIVFQRANLAYIEQVLRLLMEDTSFDAIAQAAARLHRAPDAFQPGGEVEYDLLLRREAAPNGTETAFLGALSRDYLKPDAAGVFGSGVKKRRRGELLDYAKNGLMGLEAEKAADIAGHPTPCAELWRRKRNERSSTETP